MPELPEVETTLRGIEPFIRGQTVRKVTIRHHGLRWPIPRSLNHLMHGKKILTVSRRGKYLLLTFHTGTLLIHLGMSGCLRILREYTPPKKHDHADIEVSGNIILRYTDPRRFGAILWTTGDPGNHPLLRSMGPEPFDKSFSGKYLWRQAQGKKIAIKPLIMDNKIVVGAGNIYATEALFLVGIHPATPARLLTEKQCIRLVGAIKRILRKAIRAGGTTLKDFAGSDGRPGYFSQQLKVYGRAGQPCFACKTALLSAVIGQRTTVFCPQCQKASD